jgi:hypothetical protein
VLRLVAAALGVVLLAAAAPTAARLTMRNAILMRTDRGIKLRRARAGNYATTLPIFGGLVTVVRGWAYVDATVAGRAFRFVDTHLEAFNRQVQEQRARSCSPGRRRRGSPSCSWAT